MHFHSFPSRKFNIDLFLDQVALPNSLKKRSWMA